MMGWVNRKHPVVHEHPHIQKYNHLKPNQKGDEGWAHLGIAFCPPASRPLPGALPREEQGQRDRMLQPRCPAPAIPGRRRQRAAATRERPSGESASAGKELQEAARKEPGWAAPACSLAKGQGRLETGLAFIYLHFCPRELAALCCLVPGGREHALRSRETSSDAENFRLGAGDGRERGVERPLVM